MADGNHEALVESRGIIYWNTKLRAWWPDAEGTGPSDPVPVVSIVSVRSASTRALDFQVVSEGEHPNGLLNNVCRDALLDL